MLLWLISVSGSLMFHYVHQLVANLCTVWCWEHFIFSAVSVRRVLIQISSKLANFCAKFKQLHSWPCHTDNKTSFDKNTSWNGATLATNSRLFQSKGTKFSTVAIIWSIRWLWTQHKHKHNTTQHKYSKYSTFYRPYWIFYLKSKKGKMKC